MPIVKPSLVIGVGGTGYWILSFLKRQLYISYGIDVDKSSEVKFLLLDTLSEDKFEAEHQESMKSIGEKFTIKRKEYLHLGEARGGFFNWANQQSNYMNPLYQWFRRKYFIENFTAEANWRLNEGAAQLRQFGRMAFFFNKNRIKQAIINLLDEIKETSRNSTIPVWIFGSFAGGTGAGIMFDVAILTKIIADQKAISICNIGGIVLPEVYKDTLKTSTAQGYAAFRELSRFLSGTKEMHRAKIDNQDCKHMVLLGGSDKFYHKGSIIDYLIYFNEECYSDEDRIKYFNKITDGLTIFFDYSGAMRFFNEVIDRKENCVTSISTYKIFVPINLYIPLFTASFLKEQIDKIFPNAPDSTITYPDTDRQSEIRRDIKNFLNNLSPYFLELSHLVDDDQKALQYTKQFIINKPTTIFKDLFGYSNPQKYFGDSYNNANYRNELENLFRNVFQDEEVKSADELRKYIRFRWENEKNYSLNQYLAEFKTKVDKKYQAYGKIFKKDDEDRTAIKNSILAHFNSKARDYVRLHFQEYGVSGMYYFLKHTTAMLEGNSETSGGIKRILTNIIKAEFTSLRPQMDSEVNKVSGEIFKADLETVSGGIFGSLMGKGGKAYETAAHLCDKYLEVKSKYLLFEQSDNLISLLVEIHDEFSKYIWKSLCKKLSDIHSSIFIDRNSISSNLSNQIKDIRSVIKSGVGSGSSMGITGDTDEIAAYEKYLRDNIFSEAPFIRLSADFDSETETFRLKYIDNNNDEFFDSTVLNPYDDVPPEERFWNRIYNDVYNYIVKTRLLRYEGIMHYLNWARKRFGEKFIVALEEKLLQAKRFIKLMTDHYKKYLLLYGDTTEREYKLEDDLDALKKRLSREVGGPIWGPHDHNYYLDFGDKNALIFFVYSNEIMPNSIKVLGNMRKEYTRKIITQGTVDWRSYVYHNYKCDWQMWEIEKSLPDIKNTDIKTLTHGSFYWVLEESEAVELFINTCAAGVIRKENGANKQAFWICGPTGKSYQDNEAEVICLTDPSQNSDLFTALVKFAIEKKPFNRIDTFDFDEIKKMLHEAKAILRKNGKDWKKIKSEFIEKDPLEIDIKHTNREIDDEDPDYYIKHRDLFLARVFRYYLDELDIIDSFPMTETREDENDVFIQKEYEVKLPPPVNIEELESETRNLIINHDYSQGREKLLEIIKWAPERRQMIQNEFGFLYNFDNPMDKDRKQWIENKESIDYWRKLWIILAENNDFSLKEREHETIQPTREEKVVEVKEETAAVAPLIDNEDEETGGDSQLSSQKTGEILENAVLELFHRFFTIAEKEEETLLVCLRRQKTGSQFGHDVSFECIGKDNENVACKIECKNVETKIKESDIAHKLLSVEKSHKKIDHWILFSARSDPSNDLMESIAYWQAKEKFPFDIHIWSPDSGIKEFFGLAPGIYKEFYGDSPLDDGSHPGEWSESKQVEVYQKWKNKLALKPLSRLPKEWREYLKKPVHMLLKEEKERGKELQMLFDNHVAMRCKDRTNTLLEGTMEDQVRLWLQGSEKDVMIILGEFGDGKTTFTYILAHRLANEFLADPVNGWLPLRFSLSEYRSTKHPQVFLQRRLQEFGADLPSYNELRQEKNIFIILDGFDEMSKKLDPESIRENIQDLSDIYEECKGKRIKLLITSRTHFFENKQDEKNLLQRLGTPPVFYLAPIERQKRVQYLENIDPSPTRKELLRKLCKLHDPLDLASKPLFLQMIETTLNKLQTEPITEATLDKINEIKLYSHYIEESFNRKRKQWEPDEIVDLEETGLNIFRILEQLAIKLQESQESYISVDDFSWDFFHSNKQKINDFIWKISGTDKEDAESRVQVRSLLGRVAEVDDSCQRPVKFCHRSMQEFFVARGIQRALQEDKNQARELLNKLQLNHEILHFTAELMKSAPMESYGKNLVDIIKSSKVSNRGQGPGGNAITLLYRLQGKLPGNNWSGLNLDGANLSGADLTGMKFIGASLRDANLDNVTLESADLSGCDLKGVRLEETAPVLAVTAEPMGKRIIAAYRDNTIREWKNISKQGKAESVIIFENTKGAVKWLGILNGTDLCALTNEELIFYDGVEGGPLSQRSRFRIKPQYRRAIAKKNILAILSEAGNNQNKGLLVDLEAMEIAGALEFERASLCDSLDFQAFVIAGRKSSLLVEGLENAVAKESLTLPAHEVASLCVHTCKTGERYLLACGQRDGEVLVWQMDFSEGKWQHKLLLKRQVHEGIVSSLCFLDECRVVSGGVDRKISILRFGEDIGPQGTIEQDLCLTLRCRGLKIDDVQGPREKEMLEKLIRKAVSME